METFTNVDFPELAALYLPKPSLVNAHTVVSVLKD